MADEKGQPGYSAQPETTQYQSTGRTAAPLRSGTVGSINGYTRAPGLAKPSVFDFNFKTNVCPTCQGTGRVPKGEGDVPQVSGALVRLPDAPSAAPELQCAQ